VRAGARAERRLCVAEQHLFVAVVDLAPGGGGAGSRRGSDRMTLQFRAGFFNRFNIVNFGLPNIVRGPGFGRISRTAGTSRQIQFSLKVIY
jgi:hypothetical protein